MITIERKTTEFKIKFSDPGSGRRGFTVYARNVGEVIEAIHHYLGCPCRPEDCPLCRMIEREGGGVKGRAHKRARVV